MDSAKPRQARSQDRGFFFIHYRRYRIESSELKSPPDGTALGTNVPRIL